MLQGKFPSLSNRIFGLNSLSLGGIVAGLLAMSEGFAGNNIPFDHYDRDYLEKVFPRLQVADDEPTDEYLEKVRQFLADPKLSAYEQYLARRRLAGYFQEETHRLCEASPARDDDAVYNVKCVISDPKLSYEEKKQRSSVWLDRVGLDPGQILVSQKLSLLLADLAQDNNDGVWALFLLEKTFVKVEDRDTYYRIKSRLATLYSGETNSLETIRKGLDYLVDAEAYWRQSKLQENADFSLFVLGATTIRALSQYQEGFDQLESIKLPIYKSHAMKYSYQAFALMKLGRLDKVRELLRKLEVEPDPDGEYSRHTRCLVQLIRANLFKETRIDKCLSQDNESLGLYVGFVTKELLKLPLSREDEVAVWRQYLRYQETQVIPGLQTAFDQSSNEIEVRTAKLEAALQKQKAENLEQYERYSQLMVVLIVGLCGAVSLLIWFFRDLQHSHKELKAKKLEIEGLNLVIAAENASIQKAMRLEIESKFHLASDAAHRLNNPLNYIHIGSELLLQTMKLVQSEVQALLEGADPEDSDAKTVIKHFQRHLADAETGAKSIRLGVDKAIDSILEIRGLAGVDGFMLEPMLLRDLIEESLSRLAEHRSAEMVQNIHFDVQRSSQFIVEGNRYLFKNAIEIFLRGAIPSDHVPIQLTSSVDVTQTQLIFTLQGGEVSSEAELFALEDRLNHLLGNLEFSVCMGRAEGAVTMKWVTQRPFIKELGPPASLAS